MLKHLAILTVLALGCVYPARPQVPRDGSKQDRPIQKETNSAQPTQPLHAATQVQFALAKQENSPQQKPSGYPWKELLAPANIPNWVLCLVGGFAGWAAFRTLKAIKRQADLMEDQTKILGDSVAAAQRSADAALLSANSLINAERPWIVVRQKRGIPRDQCRIIGINKGDTPAEVCELYYSVEPYDQTSTKQPEPSGWVGAYLPRNAITASLLIHK